MSIKKKFKEKSIFDNLPNNFYISISGGEVTSQGTSNYEEPYINEDGEDDYNYYEDSFMEKISIDEDILNAIESKIKEDDEEDRKNGYGSILTGKGLAEYIHDSEFKKEISSITFAEVQQYDEKEIGTIFKVKLNKNRTHSNDEIVEYCGNFILGQCSDGWGEGFEQRPFTDDNSCYYYDEPGELFFSPWTRNSTWDVEWCDFDENFYENKRKIHPSKISLREASSKAIRLANNMIYNTFYIDITGGKITVDTREENWGNESNYNEVIYSVNPDLLDILKNKIKEDEIVGTGVGLANYVKKEYENDINSILFNDIKANNRTGEITTTFMIEINTGEADHTEEDIIDYVGRFLVGQCSDGWGEGFEQRPFYENDGDFLYEKGDMYFSPWTSKSNWEPNINLTMNE